MAWRRYWRGVLRVGGLEMTVLMCVARQWAGYWIAMRRVMRKPQSPPWVTAE
jgi:hypothetical protein